MSLDGPAHEPFAGDQYKQFLRESARQRRLLSAHWELTYRCNERCTHCYLDVLAPNAPAPDELNTEECLRLLDEMANLGVLNLTLSGGDILVRRDFFQIAEYARAKRFLLRLFTNGILIKPEVANRIAALHPYAVEISVYGADALVHDRITRVPRSFELSTRALRLLNERGVRTVMKTPLMRENIHQLGAIRNLARTLGAQFHYDITITPKDTGGLSPLKHRLSYADLVKLFRHELTPEGWVGRQVRPDQPTCGISQSALVIDPKGNIFPCVQTRTCIGNVREQSLESIWRESPIWAELGKLMLDTLPVCRTCELNSLCVRCHGLAQVEDGDLRGPAIANCHEALARRQVLVEQGALPPDFPIPAHLQSFAESVTEPSQPVGWIPLTNVSVLAHADEGI